jgi:hypothetical protein
MALIILMPVTFLAWLVYRSNHPSIGINVKSFSRIPLAAHSIYYVDAPLFGQCIFILDKDEFTTWIINKKFIVHKKQDLDQNRFVVSKIKGYPMEIFDCKNSELYEWRDVDGGGFSVNYFPENGLVVYDWSSN